MYFFRSQITTAINEIEKSTQRNLNFIFYEIPEYVNFFLVSTNLVKTRLHVNTVHKNLWQ